MSNVGGGTSWTESDSGEWSVGLKPYQGAESRVRPGKGGVCSGHAQSLRRVQLWPRGL